jgi:hypothetical protein
MSEQTYTSLAFRLFVSVPWAFLSFIRVSLWQGILGTHLGTALAFVRLGTFAIGASAMSVLLIASLCVFFCRCASL